MKVNVWKRIVLCAVVLMGTVSAMAQENKFTVTPSADVVSSYIWRGTLCGGASFQPALELSYAGLSLSAWGSTEFVSGTKEVDFTLGYSFGDFNVAVTDYWYKGEENPFGYLKRDHVYEAALGYSFGESLPLSLLWSTYFYGDDKKADDADKQAYSSYFEVSYGLDVQGVTFTPAIGVLPFTAPAYGNAKEGFLVQNISLTASKEVKITDSFSLPVFTQVVFSPAGDNAFFVVGLSF